MEAPNRKNSVLLPALQVGMLSGTSGLIVGGIGGLVRSSTPGLFAIASGIQWFALGTTFWTTRSAILHSWDEQRVMPKDRTYASGIAGGITGGGVGGLLRGRANIVPGAIMFTLFGLMGQSIYNSLDAKHTEDLEIGVIGRTEPKENIWQRVAKSGWSPMKILSDEDYKKMLREKLLRIDAEIALIDEDIESLQQDTKSMEEQN